MTVGEIKDEVMFQTNNDIDDLEEYLPYLMDYINEGYDKLVYAWAKTHCEDAGDEVEYPWMTEDTEEPNLPEWTHRALADYATWLVYRNGNPQKQQRGLYFLRAFQEVLNRILAMGGKNGTVKNFFNIPR